MTPAMIRDAERALAEAEFLRELILVGDLNQRDALPDLEAEILRFQCVIASTNGSDP